MTRSSIIPPKKKVASDTTTLVQKEAGDPTHKSETEHTNFYRSKAVGKLGTGDRKLYDSLQTRDQRDADAIIALRGGTPKFEAKATTAPVKKIYSSSVSSNVGGKRKTSGFQYKANKPAKGSVTLKRK